MTRLFKRNDKTTIAELEEYYSNQGQKKNRSGVAWVYALASVIVTILIVAGLFLLARWAYREITDNNDTSTTQTASDSSEVDLPNFDGDVVGQGEQTDSAESSDVVDTGGVVTDQAATTTDGNGGETNGSSTTNSSSVATAGDLPDTGAGDFLIIAPFAAGIAGYFISRKKQISQK